MVPLLRGVCGYADESAGASEINATCATAARTGLTTHGASGGSALRQQQQQQLLQQTVEINGNNNHAMEEMNGKVALKKENSRNLVHTLQKIIKADMRVNFTVVFTNTPNES